MTDRQENKRSMYLAVQRVCNRHNSVWSGLGAFVTAFGDFEGIIQQIEDARLIQEGQTTGITENKQKEEDEMIDKTIEVGSAVFAYASDTGNNELKEKVDYSPSALMRSRDTILRDRCKLVHDETEKIISELGDYGIVETDLTELQKEIDDYTEIIAKPRTAIGTRATATTQLVELFKQGDNDLNDRMDRLVEQYKKDEKKFYREYRNARIIVDLGKRFEREEIEE